MLITWCNFKKMTSKERQRRRFSETFRKEQVKRIESGELTISEVGRLYEVKPDSVRRWVEKFGRKGIPTPILITSSSEVNRLRDLEKENARLKQVIGDQQVKLLYFQQLAEIAKEQLGSDFEKKTRSGF